MAFALPPLPWAKDALAPNMSAETISYHYGKHHATYVAKLNGFVAGTEKAGRTLEQLILSESGPVFNNAAQIYNHSFFWASMSPGGGGAPAGAIADKIQTDFGSFQKFKDTFTENAVGHFGSGWVWVVLNKEHKLEIVQTHDAACPLKDGLVPILTCDLWEHAYYIDYRNARPDFIKAWWNMVNWEYANANLAAAAAAKTRMDEYVSCRKELMRFINENNCAPIMIRLAWHDSGNFDKGRMSWPDCGGANASIIFEPEINYGANAGLSKAVAYLKPLKAKYPLISWADLVQMGSACAVEVTGGPQIPMLYGRKDAKDGTACPAETSRGTGANAGLPDAKAPFGCGASDASTHLRNIFFRMGFDDEAIVALSGAHTLGRAFKDRSGTVENGYGDKTATQYTKSAATARADGKAGVGMSGGMSWTKHWLKFDNSYFKDFKQRDASLAWFPTDSALTEDAKFNVHFTRFAESQAAFFAAYGKAHKQLSELGSLFEPVGGFSLPADSKL